jgi:hypothetical protein
MLLRKIISTVIALVFLGIVPALAYDYCTESGSGWLICEDWDDHDPAPPNANWPCEDCASWHGWQPNDTNMSTINAISAVDSHSGVYSLKCENETDGSEHPGCDIDKSLPTHPNPAYIRFYMNVAVASGTQTHLFFLNETGTADASMDFRGCATSAYNDCNNFYLVPHVYNSEYWIAYNNGHTPFDWLDHIGEWHLVEIKADFSADVCSIWIDGNYVLEDAAVDWNVPESYLYAIRISNWNNNGNNRIYIDDIVVSTSYIGPRGAEEDTTAPTVDSFTIPSTASSLNVSISAFTASDAVGVTGYCVNESATPPTAGSCSGSGWEASAQTSYLFDSEGSKTLYPWAKDAAGNISDSASQYDQVTITLPVVAPTRRGILSSGVISN